MFLDDHPIDCKIHVGVRSHQSQLITSDALHVGRRHPTSPCSLMCAKPEEATCCYDRISKTILLMVQKSGEKTTWDVKKTLVHNGINYQPQLMTLDF